MVPIGHCLLAAALSEFMPAKEWQKWADRQIGEADEPEFWLIEVSLAGDVHSLREAIEPLFQYEQKVCEVPLISDVVIGYYYLMYENNQLTIKELLQLAGDEADGGMSEFECEEIYGLLNLIEGRSEAADKTGDTIDSIRILFHECKNLALDQWDKIIHYSSPAVRKNSSRT